VKVPPLPMNEETLNNQIEDLKTDEDELNEVLDEYDLDESLEAEFDAIDAEFKELQIVYLSLQNTRRFLHDAT
jgi:hypothetical protein